jgi:hypothetical protein
MTHEEVLGGLMKMKRKIFSAPNSSMLLLVCYSFNWSLFVPKIEAWCSFYIAPCLIRTRNCSRLAGVN